MSTSTATPSRQPVEPVRGTVKWLHRLKDGIGAIEISGVAYALAELREEGRVVGYRMARHDAAGAVIYRDIDTTWQAWECDCPDWLYRRQFQDGQCKHVLALRAALAEDRGIRLYRPEG